MEPRAERHAKFIADMIEARRVDGRYKHWPKPPTDAEVCRAQCHEFCKRLVTEFPYLTMVPGFYVRGPVADVENGYPTEHWWTVDEYGTIVDPTVSQFGAGEAWYSPASDRKFPAVIGKCLNCGWDIYECLDGQQPDFGGLCSEDCATDYKAYVEKETRALLGEIRT